MNCSTMEISFYHTLTEQNKVLLSYFLYTLTPTVLSIATAGNTHLKSERGSISTADLLVLSG